MHKGKKVSSSKARKVRKAQDPNNTTHAFDFSIVLTDTFCRSCSQLIAQIRRKYPASRKAVRNAQIATMLSKRIRAEYRRCNNTSLTSAFVASAQRYVSKRIVTMKTRDTKAARQRKADPGTYPEILIAESDLLGFVTGCMQANEHVVSIDDSDDDDVDGNGGNSKDKNKHPQNPRQKKPKKTRASPSTRTIGSFVRAHAQNGCLRPDVIVLLADDLGITSG